MAAKAISAGHHPKQVKMPRPLNVAGVGTGMNQAEWEIRLPIALGQNDTGVKLQEFVAPTVGGPGKDLPALLGLQSMSRQNGVLEMGPGQEYLTFPGPGGYTIEWAPGTRRYKLERAVSGHLILPCDGYEQVVPNQGGVAEPQVTFYTGTLDKKKAPVKMYSEIGTQTDPAPQQKNTKARHESS
jgi:hypothetical protein